eukprot:6042517-Pleurochrysis_carterae.AAC.4
MEREQPLDLIACSKLNLEGAWPPCLSIHVLLLYTAPDVVSKSCNITNLKRVAMLNAQHGCAYNKHVVALYYTYNAAAGASCKHKFLMVQTEYIE